MSIEVIDPRIPSPIHRVSPAPRVEDLNHRRVVLFDNGNMMAPGLLDALEQACAQQFPEAQIQRRRIELLGETVDSTRAFAHRLGDEDGSSVVILAACDWGVSQPTAVLAAELEKLGLATCTVATTTAKRLVEATMLRLAGLARVVDADLEPGNAQLPAGFDIGNLLATIRGSLAAAPDNADKAIHGSGPGGTLTLSDRDTSLEFSHEMSVSAFGDGLPLVAPTLRLVEEFLSAAGAAHDEIIWPSIPPRSTPVTAMTVAALAVAAGCRPRWAPAVFAAFAAMSDERFRLFQAAITTHPGGTFVLISGEHAADLGFASGRGSLGPGYAANATTGRAVALSYSFLLGSTPNVSDLVAQGSPAEYSYCCAENLAESPWGSLSDDRGRPGATTVTVQRCEGPHSVVDERSQRPADLLDTFASAIAHLGSNAAYVVGAETFLLLNPKHARMISQAGWDKRDIQHYLFETARLDRTRLEGRGVGRRWPAWFDAVNEIPLIGSPHELLPVVVGGDGPASQVAIPWGSSLAVTRPIVRSG